MSSTESHLKILQTPALPNSGQELEGLLFHNLPAAVYTCDMQGRVLMYNQAALDLWGRAPDIGKDLWCGSWRIYNPDGSSLALEDCPMAVTIREKKAVQGQEIIIERPDGTRRYILPHPQLLYDAAGTPIGALNMLVDITARKKALQHSEDQFYQLANSIPQMAWMADGNGWHYWYNKRWYDYTGTTPEDMQGWGWKDLHHPDYIDTIIEKWQKVLITGEDWEYTFPLRGKNGKYRWFLTRAFPIRDDDGVIARWFGTNTDVTEQRKVEKALRESEQALQESLKQAETAKIQAEQASQRKDEFLANMSHELRTPLNAIIGIGHILSKTSPLNEKQATCIKTLQSSSESLLMLINDLLDLAKVESENIKLENIPFRLHELLEEIVSVLSISTQEKKLSFNLDYDKRLEDTYVGDQHRLKQILLNLISNAVKFTEQGSVSLRVELVNKSLSLVNVAIHIIDTGIGIPQEKLEYIFKKFSQADTSISRKYGGTGLGLAISKTLAELMGGSIAVKSQEGLGSEFTLYLPLAHDHSLSLQSNSAAMGECAKHQGKNDDCEAVAPYILIVEDYKPNLLVASSYMEMMGFDYDSAQSGEEAIQKVQLHTYDLVLMDVQMPGMDGLSATRAIRELEIKLGRKRTPIIGITAYALMGDKEKCVEAGMDDYLSKPYSPEVLQEKITSLL